MEECVESEVLPRVNNQIAKKGRQQHLLLVLVEFEFVVAAVEAAGSQYHFSGQLKRQLLAC